MIYTVPRINTPPRIDADVDKCASGTSHPHYLTWTPVEYPRPNFHLPEYFGTIVFE